MPRIVLLALALFATPLFAHEGPHLGHDSLSQGILDHGFGIFAVLAAGLVILAWRMRRRAR
jgi:hydrogenase/urease accessory protein HupE